MVLLGEPAVRAPDLVEGRAGGQPEDPEWVGRRRHDGQLADRRQLEVRDRLGAQAPVRVEDLRPVVAPQLPKDLPFEDPCLAQRLDRGRPCPAVVPVAVLDLDGHARRAARRAADARPREDREPAQRLHARLADDPTGDRLHQRGIEPVAIAADHLRMREHRVANGEQERCERRARVVGGEGRRVGQHRVGLRDLAQRERVGEHATAVERRPQAFRLDRVGTRDGLAVRDMRRVVRLPVVLERPIPQTCEQDEHRMLPGAHVAHRAGPLAVARQPSCRQLVQGHALGAAGEEPLRDARPPEHGLQRADVEVLAGMRAAQEGDVGRREVERLDTAGFEQRHRAERLDGAAKRDHPVRVPEDAEHPSARVDLDDVAAMDGLDDAIPDMAHEDRRGRPARGLRDARTGCGRTARGCGGARGAARVAGARQGVRRHLHREHTAASWRPGMEGGGVITERWMTGSRPVDPPGRSSLDLDGPRETAQWLLL